MVILAAYLYVYLFWLALPLLCLGALRWGGTAERLFGFAFLASCAAAILLKSSIANGYHELEWGVAAIDLALLLALAALATFTRRGWLIWALAFHLVAMTGHVAKLMVPGLSRMAYALMVGSQSYPLLILFALAIYQCRRRANAGSAVAT